MRFLSIRQLIKLLEQLIRREWLLTFASSLSQIWKAFDGIVINVFLTNSWHFMDTLLVSLHSKLQLLLFLFQLALVNEELIKFETLFSWSVVQSACSIGPLSRLLISRLGVGTEGLTCQIIADVLGTLILKLVVLEWFVTSW